MNYINLNTLKQQQIIGHLFRVTHHLVHFPKLNVEVCIYTTNEVFTRYILWLQNTVCLRDKNFIFQVHVALVLYLFALTPLANMYSLLIYAVLFLV